MLNLRKLFPKSAPAVKVIARRNMVVKLPDGSTQHCAAGTTIEIDANTVSSFEPGDIELLEKPQTSAAALADLPPVRADVEPVPASWSALPKCFSDWWTLAEKFSKARGHLEALRKYRADRFLDAVTADGTSGNVIVGRLGVEGGESRIVNLSDPSFLELRRISGRAETAAEEHLATLKRDHALQMQRLNLECSNERLKAAETLKGIVEELAETGFEIFKTRISALGLSDLKIRQLFGGSADYVKYASEAPASFNGLAQLGYNDRDEMLVGFDGPVVGMGTILLGELARIERLTPLLASAKKELAKTVKAAGPQLVLPS